ncbi:hypothetical protein BKA70DRAFT_1229813 [Coprinopsis sp. MPI-PUGE-AT-0042]|nr:hypothetical protein BKA70DRAFT_1229813 [Coprinopsis sp. MPI-PUGE-AT-0042]
MADPSPPPTAHTSPHSSADTFHNHLIVLLSFYEMEQYTDRTLPVPQYGGPCNWEMDQILKSLSVLAKRMWVAEERVKGLVDQGQQYKGDKPRDDGETEKRLDVPSNMLTYPVDSSAHYTPLASRTRPSPTVSPVDSLNATDAVALSVNNLCNGYPFAPPECIDMSPPMTLSSVSLAREHGSGGTSPGESGVIAPLAQHEANQHFMVQPGGCSPSVYPSITSLPPETLTDAEDGPPISVTEELQLLKMQVTDVARVCNAVARGDLSKKITAPVWGALMVQLKDVVNGMVDKLVHFAKEGTCSSQEVSGNGGVGDQALVLDVEKMWRELTGVVKG